MNSINKQIAGFESLPGLTDDYSDIKTINSDSTFKIKVPADFQKKVDYLHTRFPNKEWSGFGFAKYNQETINNDLEVELVDLYPLHLGTSTFTSFEQTEDFAGFMADNLEYMGYKLVYVHTHHSMGAFHSGTDSNTLKRLTALGFNVLFLVVDTRNTWWGHISALVETRVQHSKKLVDIYGYDVNNNRIAYDILQDTGGLEDTTETRKTMVLYRGIIEYESYTNGLEGFTALADKIETASRKVSNTFPSTHSTITSIRDNAGSYWRTEPKLFAEYTGNSKHNVNNGNALVRGKSDIITEDYLSKETDIYDKGVLVFSLNYVTILFLKALFQNPSEFLVSKLEERDFMRLRKNWVEYIFDGVNPNHNYDKDIHDLIETLREHKYLDYSTLIVMEIESIVEELVGRDGIDEGWYILQDVISAFNIVNEDEDSDYAIEDYI